MKRKLVWMLFAGLMLVSFSGCGETQKSDPYGLAGKTHSAVTPTDRKGSDWDWWTQRHQQVLDRVAEGNVDLIFIGDSITQGWDYHDRGLTMWNRYYVPRHAVNMGFGGDRTQQVLWRLDHGEIDGICPKLAIVMIGTNNSGENTAEEIADGIKAICAKIRTKTPKTKILILAIFPRDEGLSSPLRENNAKASKLASTIADGKHIFYLNINKKFLESDGTLSKDLFVSDLLHPSEKGYQIWVEAIEPTVKNLMGEK